MFFFFFFKCFAFNPFFPINHSVHIKIYIYIYIFKFRDEQKDTRSPAFSHDNSQDSAREVWKLRKLIQPHAAMPRCMTLDVLQFYYLTSFAGGTSGHSRCSLDVKLLFAAAIKNVHRECALRTTIGRKHTKSCTAATYNRFC